MLQHIFVKGTVIKNIDSIKNGFIGINKQKMVWQIGSDEFHIPMYWLLEIKLLSVIGIFFNI